jgi:hypothetical protein
MVVSYITGHRQLLQSLQLKVSVTSLSTAFCVFRCLFALLQVTLINSKENHLKFCVLRYGIQSVLYY